jgi:hypothetical protein
MRRPELAQHVTMLKLLRNNRGYDLRKAIGLPDRQNQNLAKLAATAPNHVSWETFTDAISDCYVSVTDKPCELVCSILRILPQVKSIDALSTPQTGLGIPF